MRDLHVADVGDFGKFGLLRWLVGPDDLGRQLTLGVIWYYWKESGFSYMNPPNPEGELAKLDSQLYQALESLALPRTGQVESLERLRILPPDTTYFRDVVSTGQSRAAWFESAMEKMGDCDVVFLDPDKGLQEVPDTEHTTYQEAAQLWRDGKSLVVYQSFGRPRGMNATRQIHQKASRLRQELGINGSLGELTALWFRRHLARVFFVMPNPDNSEVAQLLRERVDSFMASCWGDHFTRVDC